MPYWWFMPYNYFIDNPSTIFPESLTVIEKIRQLELEVQTLEKRVKVLEDKQT